MGAGGPGGKGILDFRIFGSGTKGASRRGAFVSRGVSEYCCAGWPASAGHGRGEP